ncbi:sulfatase-like hydrolase/transferase [Chitinophaga agrisoli]|uniref:Sulfatase-like hydrolase/transferase n=1 Tax=Chitinophaga agrisoli TaxID=2607653 RepID=A0A5B2VNQ2_9BACT|nr:sulfatase-like hydrolase/transferase [Chitinophaga agrisoli]KAA2241303.1 sulfatase-like hydrolase/transferase [Chitinophaga agrisoli]
MIDPQKNKPGILLALVLTAIAFGAGHATAQSQPDTRPNIIYILTDDMGYADIGCFGGNFVPTPNIDRLAANGRKFTHFYSAAPICSPSRAGFITGNYPGRWNFSTYLDNRKHNRNAQQADFLDPAAPTIAKFFKNAGYATGHFGKWHMGGGRDVTNAPGFEKYGFDEHVSTYESPDPDPLITATNWIWSNKDSIKRWDRTKYFVDKTLAFLQKHKGQPCFINLWPDDVHTPWVPRTETEYTGKFPMNPEEEAAFKLVLKEYDVQIGRLLDGLKAMGLDKNTIVIFTSDNGPLPGFRGSRAGGLRGSKLSLFEGGTRMPFIISWPGHIKPGTTDETSALSALDLLPSLVKIAGGKLPPEYHGDGQDRSQVLLGKPSARNMDMYWEYGRNNIAFAYPKGRDKSPNLAIRSGQWKLLMDHGGSNAQLYNINKDPNESNDLVNEYPKIVRELKDKLSKWWDALPKLVQD